MQERPLRVLDLFCGCGGMTQGLTDAGLSVIAGVDVWAAAIHNYRLNHTHPGIVADLTQFPPSRFQELYDPEREGIDVLVGGPPCQSFSMAGKRDANDPRNTLFMEYVRYLEFFQPSAFVMENVVGMLSKQTETGEKVIDQIMGELGRNYHCRIDVLYASDFEVPQNRRRVIIIGFHHRMGQAPPPVLEKIIPHVEDRPAVGNVLLPREQVEKGAFLSQRAIQGIGAKKARSREKGVGFGAQFLDLSKPSYTILARYWKDGYDALVKYSETEIRRLTILELKRIQTFSDDYRLEGSKREVVMQIGNAVPCRFAYHIGMYLRRFIVSREQPVPVHSPDDTIAIPMNDHTSSSHTYS